MTTQEVIARLRDLIRDRESFLDGSPEHDEVFRQDILALQVAVKRMEGAKTHER